MTTWGSNKIYFLENKNKSVTDCIYTFTMKIMSRFCSAHALRSRIGESRQRLYRVALAWCGNEMLADDLVQEAMTTAIRKCHQLREHERLTAWLYTILNNTWRQYLRRRKDEIAFEEEMLSSDAPGPEGSLHALEIVTRVRTAVGNLPMEQRQLVSLVDLEGFSYGEVADILGIPMGTVMSRLHRARKALQVSLEEVHMDISPPQTRIRRVK